MNLAGCMWLRCMNNTDAIRHRAMRLLVEVLAFYAHSSNNARHIATWLTRVLARVHPQDVQHIPEVEPNSPHC